MSTTRAYGLPNENDLRATAASLEKQILESSADAASYVELMVLYWQSTDYGLSVASNLSADFFTFAGVRLAAMLEIAEKKFPENPLVLFWTKYIKWIDFGEPFELQDCRNLLRTSESMDPALMLFMASGGLEARQEISRLLDLCADKNTVRCGYIKSVADGVLKRHRFQSGS